MQAIWRERKDSLQGPQARIINEGDRLPEFSTLAIARNVRYAINFARISESKVLRFPGTQYRNITRQNYRVSIPQERRRGRERNEKRDGRGSLFLSPGDSRNKNEYLGVVGKIALARTRERVLQRGRGGFPRSLRRVARAIRWFARLDSRASSVHGSRRTYVNAMRD